MKEFKVTDLLPRRAEFYLSIPDKAFSLRPCTPHDLINLKNMSIDIEEVMKNPISSDVCKVVLYLMDYEDAKEFKKIELKTINIETGEEEVNDVGGYKLLMKFIASLKEHLEMFLALLNSMGFSEKVIGEIREATLTPDKADESKKVIKKKAKILRKKKR
tara:strand:+ start:204 stop:683 length:480 start_codon:yes stop_codon:yes gene_type:complete